jgi:hypothetical protein
LIDSWALVHLAFAREMKSTEAIGERRRESVLFAFGWDVVAEEFCN